MYAEWPVVALPHTESTVLDAFTPATGKFVASALVKELAHTVNADVGQAAFATDEHVKWTMQVLSFGLTLPFTTEYETIRDCVKLYSSWLTVISKDAHPTVPKSIKEDPKRYARVMIVQLRALFAARPDSDANAISRQAKEAHFLLRCVQSLLMQSRQDLKDDIWPEVLKFFLAVNDDLLAAPSLPDDLSSHLAPKILPVLFETWVHACGVGQFPSPSFWKTFRVMCRRWRHHVSLIENWARKCLLLTVLAVRNLYGQEYCKIVLTDEQSKFMPKSASSEVINQTWFRMLHLLGCPSEILTFEPEVASAREPMRTGLSQLPYCFFRAASAISRMIDVFQGDNEASIDFTESDDLNREWTEINRTVSENWAQQHAAHLSKHIDHGGSAPSSILKSALGIQPGNAARLRIDSSRSPTSVSEAPPGIAKLRPSNFVWSCLKSHQLKTASDLPSSVSKPKVAQLLNIFGEWLFACAVASKSSKSKSPEDSVSQRSFGSLDVDIDGRPGSESNRRSVGGGAASTASSDISSVAHDWPGVDGVAAGRAEAIGALCRIVCAKTSLEPVPEQYLTKFFTAVRECLLEKDRLILCSLIFNGVHLFRIGLRGVDILMPLALDAFEMVVVESDKLRLHPSISEVEMRRACLRLLASLVSWPTHYGNAVIAEVGKAQEKQTFIGLRPKIYRNIMHSLKTETDSYNLQLVLGLASLFCEESSAWESASSQDGKRDLSGYCNHAVRGIVSSVCDNLGKRWSSDLAVCLAAIDCLNSISSLPINHLFSSDDVSTGALIVTSLCRFIESQLSRPPPLHSRDLHSTVVAAFSCLSVWLTSAPVLAESEPCLKTVAETIELGVAGGKNLMEEARKPASQRVHDAAEQLLFSLFSVASSPVATDVEDEAFLRTKFGKFADPSKFRHFFLNQNSLMSIVELTECTDVAKGLPTVGIVVRSPHHLAKSMILTLRPRASDVEAPRDSVERPQGVEPVKQTPLAPAYFPPDLAKMTKCQADGVVPPLCITLEAEKLKKEIEASLKSKKEEEKWQSAKSDHSTKDIKPPAPATNCKVGRLFLYDLGFLESEKIGRDIMWLDSSAADFDKNLYDMVDRSPAKTLETVHVFFVRGGQRTGRDILDNAMNIQNTSAGFCRFLAYLGQGIDVENHQFWTGNWQTSFSEKRDHVTKPVVDHYTLDGLTNALWWDSPLMEMAFLVPTDRLLRSASNLGEETEGRLQKDALSSSDSDIPVRPPRTKSTSTMNGEGKRSPTDYRIFVAWLQRFEDYATFPIDELLPVTDDGMNRNGSKAECVVIFVYPLPDGLVRIKIKAQSAKLGMPTPLLDGMVISEGLLPSAVRQTVASISRRRSLEQENYQMPHLRRKQRIQEFGKKYSKERSFPDFMFDLLH
uniref:Ral GTPase-activating protein subunit alpha/beta N-terminal domain-containing protein n=1 Tax=Plectus sambesii TaxID=2011161 RepID=A0A914USJ1_9BILA